MFFKIKWGFAMNKNEHTLFPLSVKCLNDIKYMGTNTAWATMSILRNKIIELDELASSKSNAMSIIDMMELLQFQIMFRNMLKNISGMFENLQCKPIITSLRTHDWFVVGENVVCMVKQENIPDVTTAVKCHVVDIVDAMGEISVFVSTNNKYDFLKRRGCYFGIYPVDSPNILKQWEYDFLIKDVQFAKVWMQVSKNSHWRI